MSDFLLDLRRSLAHKGFAKILNISTGMPACPVECNAYSSGAVFANPYASRSQHISSQKIAQLRFKGKYITARDIGIAKNYLSEEELKQLNLIVSMYLDFAELQATNGRLMKMQDWIQKLDDFLQISEKELLTNAGKISHEKALDKAKIEYEKYRKEEDKKYISDFDREVKKLLKNENE